MKRRLIPRITVNRLALGGLFVACFGLLLVRLGSIVPGFAPIEQPLPPFRPALEALLANPLGLPYKLAQLLVSAVLPYDGFTASRLPAVVIGLIIIATFFWVMRSWYGQRLAIFGAVLVVTAPWFLHVSRLADSAVGYPLAMTLALLLALFLHRKQYAWWLLYFAVFLATAIVYTPGGIWLLLCVLFIEHRTLITNIKTLRRHTVIASVLGLVTLLPLAMAVYRVPNLGLQTLGWFGGWPTFADYFLRFIAVWLQLFVGGYREPAYNLAGLPVLNILVTVAFLTGLYLYARHLKAARTRLLGLLLLVSSLLVSLPGQVNIALIIPVIMVLATGGIGYLLHLWLKVFPRNPVARLIGISLIAVVVLFAMAYNLRNYYVAWPANAATKAEFSQQQ